MEGPKRPERSIDWVGKVQRETMKIKERRKANLSFGRPKRPQRSKSWNWKVLEETIEIRKNFRKNWVKIESIQKDVKQRLRKERKK